MKNIVLIGFMGAGKSSIGEELANLLNLKFIEVDKEIEADAGGLSVPEIFNRYGEQGFRKLEKATIKKIADRYSANTVIAPGGGAIVDPENLELLKRNGVLIWLKLSPQEAYKRLKDKVYSRPMLYENRTTERKLYRRIKALMSYREPFYSKSDYKVDTDGLSVGEAAYEVLKILLIKEQLSAAYNKATQIKVKLKENSYFLYIKPAALCELGELLEALNLSPKVLLIYDSRLPKAYIRDASSSLQNSGFLVKSVGLRSNERSKSIRQLMNLYQILVDSKFDRSSTIIALGGGVIGDLSGYAAATYMRGINLIQVPTTLLAQVDSAIGGKVGINLKEGKNLIGSFYQPKLVVIDPILLKSLPKRELISGCAEVVKYAVISNHKFFEYLQKNYKRILSCELKALKYVIEQCCKIKAKIVEQDEHELYNIRTKLNFGHTIGHSIEAAAGYRRCLRHGEAISIGMVMASELAKSMGICSCELSERIKALLNIFGLPTALPNSISIDKLLEHMRLDKKIISGKLRLLLPKELGNVEIYEDIDEKLIAKVLRAYKK